MKENNYDFYDEGYYGIYKGDPLQVLLINEQFNAIRKAFYNLDENTKNILDYFIIQNEIAGMYEMQINHYIQKLRDEYFALFNSSIIL